MHTEATDEPRQDTQSYSALAEISSAMVRIYKERFGRGPTKARSHFAGPDVLVVSLENTLTAVEKSMRDLGEKQRLEEIRLFFQNATRDEFVGVVERITGRKVRAFTSGMDADVDVATEAFYFEPEQ
jgi:uncharacterized protein YbcI